MKAIIKKFLFVLSSFCLVVFLFGAMAACNLDIILKPNQNGNNEGGNNTVVIAPKISFSVSEKALTIGDEEYLMPVYQKTNGFTLTYESSDPTVVKVDGNGKIYAEKAGTATIKAVYSKDEVKSEASLLVTSSFGGFLPELKTMGVDEEIAITLDSTYMVLPYVTFNGKDFEDATLSYSIVDDSIAEISSVGEITAKMRGETELLIQAAWRGKDMTNTPTLQKVVKLSVVDDVRFYNAGEPIMDEALYTLAEFDGKTYKNSMPCNFKVSVNGVEQDASITIEDENVVVKEGNALVANGFGTTNVLVEKDVDGKTYTLPFTIEVKRIEKEITQTLPLFSTVDGTYFDVQAKQSKSVLAFINDENEIVDAYQKSRALNVENGKVLGVVSSSESGRGTAEISVGTKKLVYHFTMETLAKAIAVKEDLKALELSSGKTLNGYYELLGNIDAMGVTLNHTVTNDASFSGVFNGNGYVINNLSLVENSSMFGVLSSTAIVKNFALSNLNATKAYFLAQNTLNDGLTISDVYIQIAPETVTPRGITGRTGANSVYKNVVIEYLGENAESNRNYADRWTWQGLVGGMWSYESGGRYFAQDKKWSDVYVISPFVVSFRTDEKKDSEGNIAAVYGYGANESKDIYGNSLASPIYTRDNPNLGQYWWTSTYFNVVYTNLYRYGSYADLRNAKNDYSSFSNKYWVEYNNQIAWKALALEKVDAQLFDGNTVLSEDAKLKEVGKKLNVKAYIDGFEITNITVSVENSDYVQWDTRNKVLKVVKLPQKDSVKVKVNVTVKLGEDEVVRSFELTVSSRQVTPIQPGGNYETGDSYDGYYGEIVDPIQPGGNYDASDYGN